MQKLENKMAFITGGTSGMGLATAKEFINQGASVIITSRSQQSINSTLDELGTKAYGFCYRSFKATINPSSSSL